VDTIAPEGEDYVGIFLILLSVLWS